MPKRFAELSKKEAKEILNSIKTFNKVFDEYVEDVVNFKRTPFFSLKEIYDYYYKCIKKKKNAPNTIEFEVNKFAHIAYLFASLNTGTYEPGRPATFVYDEGPKRREIFAALFRDRIIHHKIIDGFLLGKMKEFFIEDSYACIEGRGVSYGIERLRMKLEKVSCNYTKKCYINKFDLSRFFVSIHKPILLDFVNMVFFEEISPVFLKEVPEMQRKMIQKELKKIILNNPAMNCIFKQPKRVYRKIEPRKSLFNSGLHEGLAVGNLTSQMLANLFMTMFDKWFIEHFEDLEYGRYVDDFFAISDDLEKLQGLDKTCGKWLHKNLQVELNRKKTRICDLYKGYPFIGTLIKGELNYVLNKTKGKFWNKVRRFIVPLLDAIEAEGRQPSYKELSLIRDSLNSYLGYMRDKQCYNIIAKTMNDDVLNRLSPYMVLKNGHGGSTGRITNYRVSKSIRKHPRVMKEDYLRFVFVNPDIKNIMKCSDLKVILKCMNASEETINSIFDYDDTHSSMPGFDEYDILDKMMLEQNFFANYYSYCNGQEPDLFNPNEKIVDMIDLTNSSNAVDKDLSELTSKYKDIVYEQENLDKDRKTCTINKESNMNDKDLINEVFGVLD